MLRITIPESENFDEVNQVFVFCKGATLQLEHSLVSISKWEAKWRKPFLSKDEKTAEETLDYVKCMTLTQNVDPAVYDRLTPQNIQEINDYIATPMTATFFSDDKRQVNNREPVTSELIYYWMIALTIPVEFQKWHLSRLLTLIKVCNIKNTPPKKQSKRSLMNRNAAINAARRQRLNSRG